MDSILKERNIDTLQHFTSVENLESILSYGLLPRSTLESSDKDFLYNDFYRYDKCKNAVCTSIEFPNYKMFYRLRQENPEVDWVVIALDASIILDFDCAFCTSNAGSGEIYNIPIERRKGKAALRKLFQEIDGGPTRKEMGIYDYYPTNPQAEVLVFGTIPLIYFKEIYFESQGVLNTYKKAIPGDLKAMVHTPIFKYRRDWEYW